MMLLHFRMAYRRRNRAVYSPRWFSVNKEWQTENKLVPENKTNTVILCALDIVAIITPSLPRDGGAA